MSKAKQTAIQEDSKRTTAATFRMNPDLLYKIRYIAFTEEISQADIIESSLLEFITKWEKKNGTITGKKK